MLNRTYFQIFFLFFALSANSQNETDLYRFSRTTYNGSARYEAMGGSFGALGADLSSSQSNPAGYGRYSSSQFGMTFYGGANSNNSTFNSELTKSTKGLGGISNAAVILTEDASEESQGILYKQLGFGINRIENFKNKVNYKGQQYSSLLDEFTSQAYGYSPEYLNTYFPFSTFMGYETYALNFDPSTQSYYSLLNSGDVYHDRTIESSGGQTELFFSYSVNYLNKLYIGANIGLRYHKYEELTTHNETLLDTTGTSLRGFEYTYDLKTKGWGGNLKIGAIYMFSEALRVGLAIHTPTFSELEDNWTGGMQTEFEDSTSVLADVLIPTGNYKYRIRSPFRAIGSLAYVFGTNGCINIDIEAIDYRMAHFRSTNDQNYAPYNYETENAYAKTVFTPALNVRIGGELVLMSMLYVRGGFAYYGKGFQLEQEVENTADIILSGGIGIKTIKYQLDIAYKRRANSRNYYAFSQSMTEVQLNTHQVAISLGITL